MANKLHHLRKLEQGIDWVGQQWHGNGDRMFWWEADVQGRLLGYLWDSIAEPVPLVHAQVPVRKKANQGGRQHYDLALFEPEIAKQIVQYDWRFSNYGDALAKRGALAAIEIKLMGCWLRKSGNPTPGKRSLGRIKEDIEKLELGKDEGQIDHAYQLVFCEAMSISAQGKPRVMCALDQLEEFQNDISSHVKGLSHKINVYWASNHPEDTPRWLHKCCESSE